MSLIEPFALHVPQEQLGDLRQRLERTRWPDEAPVSGWEQGAPSARLRVLADHWRTNYDWRKCEALLNSLGQFRTHIDGLDIHFLHIRSAEPDAMPLLLTHGWPGSVLEFRNVIGPLTDPLSHGGKASDAFHLIIPSLPGYGFSGKPPVTGWGVERIAKAWAELMRRLGYDRYVAQGGDWGSLVTMCLAVDVPPELAAVHFNMLSIVPPDLAGSLHPEEQTALESMRQFNDVESAYARLQATKPQTIGFALADSPIGQAAWIYEKIQRWSDCDGMPESVFSMDEMLDNITLYWLTNSGASSARLYWESMSGFRPRNVQVPLGYSHFPREIIWPARAWADRYFENIIHWNHVEKGGHFAAWEQPGIFVRELRDCFRTVRG